MYAVNDFPLSHVLFITDIQTFTDIEGQNLWYVISVRVDIFFLFYTRLSLNSI